MAHRIGVVSFAIFALLVSTLTLGSSSARPALAAGGYHYRVLQLVGDLTMGAASGSTAVLPGDESSGQEEPLIPFRSGVSQPVQQPIPGGPNPSPQARATSNPGHFGFPGMTHLDQRNAGTGIYTNTQFNLEPPDQGLCVGNGFVLETVNTALAVHSTSGTLLKGPIALNQFFGLSPEINRSTGVRGDFASDPKCYFDRDTNRWFLTLLEIDAVGVRTHVEIGVSKTGDPTGTWTHLRLDATDDGKNGTPSHAGCPCFGDQPLIGADHFGFYISTNEFTNDTEAFTGVQLYAMSKWSLAAGVLPTVVHFDAFGVTDGTDVSIQPTTTPTLRGEQGDQPGDSNEEDNNGTEFLISGQFAFNDQNLIALWALTNTRSLSNPRPTPQLFHAPLSSQPYSFPISVFQKDGPRPRGDALGGRPAPRIAANDFRMQQAVFAKGRVWAALTTRMQATNPLFGGRKAGVAFFIVKPNFDNDTFGATISAQGYVSLSDASLLYPAVGVNHDGRAAVAMSLVGRNDFPSAAYVELSETAGAGPVHIAAAGTAPADGFTGYPACPTKPCAQGIERWGDYGAAVADEQGNIWFASEFISNAPRNLAANWATFISRLSFGSDQGNQ